MTWAGIERAAPAHVYSLSSELDEGADHARPGLILHSLNSIRIGVLRAPKQNTLGAAQRLDQNLEARLES
jgi:hypothetical protein